MAATRMGPANQSEGTNTKDVVYPRLVHSAAGTSAADEYHRGPRPAPAAGPPGRDVWAWSAWPWPRPACEEVEGPTRAVLLALSGAALLAAWWYLRSGPDPERWRRGAAGERATAALLDRLPARTWAVLHDRRVPGSRANLDHLIIGPSGVWVLDTKTTRARVRATLADCAVRRPPPRDRSGEVGGAGGRRPIGSGGATARGCPWA